jgi:hypothetical protein
LLIFPPFHSIETKEERQNALLELPFHPFQELTSNPTMIRDLNELIAVSTQDFNHTAFAPSRKHADKPLPLVAIDEVVPENL